MKKKASWKYFIDVLYTVSIRHQIDWGQEKLNINSLRKLYKVLLLELFIYPYVFYCQRWVTRTDKNLPHPNILTCRDVGLWHSMWQICCTTSCRIVVSLSVGGVVQHVRIAGVRVVEFGTNCLGVGFAIKRSWVRFSARCSEISCNVKWNVYLAMEIPDRVSFVSGQNSDDRARSCEPNVFLA